MASKKRQLADAGIGSSFAAAVYAYRSKYYNLFRANFKWTGVDSRQEEFIMNSFYGYGYVAAFKIKNLDELGFARWTKVTRDMYGEPETVQLINLEGSPLVPASTLVRGKDVALGWIQPSRKSIAETVDWYIDRIAQVEMVINTNLQLMKMPFLIPVDSGNEKLAKDIVSRILSNELVITAEGIEPGAFKAVATGAPYIIDKLQEYKVGLENELKTYLGIDNQGAVEKREQLNLDETNANNDEINDHCGAFMKKLKEFTDEVKDTFGIEIKVEPTSDPVSNISAKRDYEEAPGPEEGSEND